MSEELVQRQLKTICALNFRDSLDSTQNLYMFIGRNAAWADEEEPDEPVNSVNDEFGTRDYIFAIKKVSAAGTALVIPRVDWTTATVYDEYSATDEDLFTKEFYVLTDDFNVYKCISNNSGAESTNKPTGTITTEIQTADGYTWKFMYNLSGAMIQTFLNPQSTWLPVPVGIQKTSYQTNVENAATYVNDSNSSTPAEGHGANAGLELGAKDLMIYTLFNGTEEDVISVADTYRQVGLWFNPKNDSGDLITGNIYAVGGSASAVDVTTGHIGFVENRTDISRDENQAETIQLILGF